MKEIMNGKGIVNEITGEKKCKNKKMMRFAAICSMIFAVLYIVLPYDFDGTILGRLDDFMLFMAAFCFLYSQFLGEMKMRAVTLLNVVSLFFCILWVITYVILIFWS